MHRHVLACCMYACCVSIWVDMPMHKCKSHRESWVFCSVNLPINKLKQGCPLNPEIGWWPPSLRKPPFCNYSHRGSHSHTQPLRGFWIFEHISSRWLTILLR